MYVFVDSGGTWTQTQKLTPDDIEGLGDFGNSVALDGNIALIGAPYAGTNGNVFQGAAYVFKESAGVWKKTRKLLASDGVGYPEDDGDYFGWSVAISGATALVGAPLKRINGEEEEGAAYFYGESNLGLNVSAPATVGPGQQYTNQTIATNSASAPSPAVSATITVPAAASFVSASASQGSCNEHSGVVTCDFGAIDANAGTATANVTLKATGAPGTTIENTAGIARATPALTTTAATEITGTRSCPDGYTAYTGTLPPNGRTRWPRYQAPAGVENAILTAPSGFRLYVRFQNAQKEKTYRIAGKEVHRRAPAGSFLWAATAGDGGGAYRFCLLHP